MKNVDRSSEITVETQPVKVKYPVLTKDQILFAHNQLKESHFLEETPYTVAFPWLGILPSCFGNKKDPKGVEEPLIQHNSSRVKKQNLQTDKAEQDPLMKLGYGIVAYKDMLWVLSVAFTVFTIISLPCVFIYQSGQGYDFGYQKLQGYEIYSLGNLGYSSVQCAQIPVGIGVLQLQCPYGTIGSIISYGVNNVADGQNGQVCVTNPSNAMCQPNNPAVASQLDLAIGSQTFSFDFDMNALWTNTTTCNSIYNPLFVQYTCVMSEQEQSHKFKSLCVITFSGVLICCLFTILTKWLYSKGKINQIEWNMATITAGDYTVELQIQPKSFKAWYENVYLPKDYKNEVPSSLSLKKHLISILEEQLTLKMENARRSEAFQRQASLVQMLETTFKKKEKQVLEIKVADVRFAFENHKLIQVLKARGDAILAKKWDKVQEHERAVQEMLKNDIQNLTTPTAAFITFEEEEGVICALKTKDSELEILPGQKFGGFKKAAEPTDIIWENRYLTYFERTKRALIAYGLVMLILGVSFYFIFFLAAKETWVTRVFPTVDCQSISTTYGTQLKAYAYFDYRFIQANPGVESSGCLQCYCYQQYQEFGFTAADQAVYGPDNSRMCGEFFEAIIKAKTFKSGLEYSLSIFNVLLRYLVIYAVTWIRYETQTEQLQKVTIVTFVCQFFNTAFLLLLVNADLSEQPFPTFGFNKGSLGDFNSQFFKTIGNSLISTMIFNSFYPLIEAFGYWAMRLFFRWMDRGFGCNKYKTKTTSIQAYQNLYQGPIYMMHYKYSTVLNVCFVTMMYGFGLPILFPIAILAMFILYMVEKTMLYYAYKMPPMYNERLSEMVIRIMQLAPLFYVMFGYWMCSSKQLLSNDHLTPIQKQQSTFITHHTYVQVFTQEGWSAPAWPLLAMTCLLALIYFLGPLMQIGLAKLFPSYIIGDIEVQNDMDNYWASLDDNDRNWTIKEEQNSRSLMKQGLRQLTDESYERLLSAKPTKGNTLVGTHSYDILANIEYANSFQYVSVSVPNREMFIIDDDSDEGNDEAQSNMVRVALNLGYLYSTEEIKFAKETFSIGFKEAMMDKVDGFAKQF